MLSNEYKSWSNKYSDETNVYTHRSACKKFESFCNFGSLKIKLM